MRRNKLRELMDAGKPSLGTHIHSPWPSIIEMVGQSGMFDYVEYVAEYAPYDLHTMDNLGRAIDLFDEMSAMIKIEQGPRAYLASRAMGAGIHHRTAVPRAAGPSGHPVGRLQHPLAGKLAGAGAGVILLF